MKKAHKLTHLPTLTNWLTNTVSKSGDGKYYHRRLEENLDVRVDILNELQSLMHQAHEDARQKLRNLTGMSFSLDPLEEEETLGIDTSIIDNFPRYLELTTLKGYFGEIMAAVVAEHFNPFDENWQVFAFPFRLHQTAYHALEKVRQEGGSAPTIIGRLGDDMLAFRCDDQGKITHVLFCEAKCTATNNSKLVSDAHKKSSDEKLIPNDCLFLIEILKDYKAVRSEAERWIHALQNLWWSAKNPTHERCDLVNYICGLPPTRESTVIIPISTPHEDYTARRRLEAIELHLHDVNGLIEEAYRAITQPITCTLNEAELSTLWDKVVFYIPTQYQLLIQENCHLLSFDGEEAVIRVHFLTIFREIQRRISSLQTAFQLSGVFTPKIQEKIKIRLKVA